MDGDKLYSMKDLIIAYSSGYENGHDDTIKGFFYSNGESDIHDFDAKEWVQESLDDGVFNRELGI